MMTTTTTMIIVTCCCCVQTVGYDPIIGGAESREFGVEWMSLDELWPHADYITLHTPLIAKTKRECPAFL